MQKTPMYSSSKTIIMLMLVGATAPLNFSSAQSSGDGSGMSSLAQREIIRRQKAVSDADELFIEGREAYSKEDYQQAVDKFRQALGKVPESPALADRRQSYTEHLTNSSVALAQQFRKVGKYNEARQILDGVLAPDIDPDNEIAKQELNYLEDPILTNPALDYTYTQNVDQVRRDLYMAQGNFDLGKFDDAKNDYENVIRIDPYNTAARRGLEKVAATKSDYFRAARDHTRADLLMQVDKAWELTIPADVPVFVDGQNSGLTSSDGAALITEKLRKIIIPRIDFDDTTVEEAIDFLRLRAAELDTVETSIDKKGVNFVIRRPTTDAVSAADDGLDSITGNNPLLNSSDLGSLRIDNLNLKNLPLSQILKYICEKTKLRYKVDDYAVTLVPQSEEGQDLFTRTFRVPPDFASSLSTGGEDTGGGEVDPFAAAGASSSKSGLVSRPPIIELLRNAGIRFEDGSSASLVGSGNLLVTNTPSELDKLDQLVESAANSKPKQVRITTKFVEISQDNSEELGFDWIISPFGLSSNSLFGTGGTVGSGSGRTGADFIPFLDAGSNSLVPGIGAAGDLVTNTMTSGLRTGDYAVSRNSIDSILNNTNRSSQTTNVAPGILGLTGLFSDGQMQVIMRGLSQKKGTDLMTAPSITAKPGQKATIEVIREFIYPTEYSPPEIPQSIGGSISGGGGFGLGGGAPPAIPVTPANPEAFETKNTGVTLEIEPAFTDQNSVIDISFVPEIVEFEGFINYGSPILTTGTNSLGNPISSVITENRIEMPVFSKRSVNTQLTVYDGYTVAVGGLMREDVQAVHDKVPILGDIPLLGRLFQSDSESRIKSNLIIFITAEIIDPTGMMLRGSDTGVSTPVIDGAGVLPPIEGLPD